MTLAELRGSVIMRLGPRDRIPIAAVDIEIFNAMNDVIAALRTARNERIDRIAYSNLVANLDIYPWPDDAEEIRGIWFLNFGKTPIPMTKIAFVEQPHADWVGLAGSIMPFTYVELPDRRIRTLQIPITSSADTLMWKYFPRARKLVKEEDEPNLPAQTHEAIAARATMRMASYDGIGLSHPASFNFWKQTADDTMWQFIQPESIGGGDHVVDFDGYYPGGA